MDYKIESKINVSKLLLNKDNYNLDEYNENKINKNILNKINNNEVIFLNSGMGTGKTTIMKDYLKDVKVNIISLISRVSLIVEHKKMKSTMISYKENILSKNLICQLDSIIKVSIDKFKDGILIIDEATSLFNYLRSDTLKGKRLEVMMKLIKLIKQAKKVICLDANITDIVVELILSLRNTKKYYFYYNDYKPKENIKCYIHNEDETLINCLLTDIKNNDKFICCFDSLTKMKAINNMIKGYINENKLDRNVKCYSSEEGEELIDTNTWKDTFVLYSPKIIYGIDYSNYEYETKVYCIVTKKLLSPLEIKQQIGRCRNQKELHIYVNNKESIIKYRNKEDLINEINENFKSEEALIKDEFKETSMINFSDELNLNTNNIYTKIYINNEFINHVLKSDMKQCITSLLKIDGYIVENFNKNNEIINFTNEKIIEESIEKEIDEDFIIKLNLDQNNLTDLEKELLTKPKKYSQHKNICSLCYNDEEFMKDYSYKSSNETKIEISKSDIIKRLYLRKINKVLGIDNLILYNYKEDSKKYKDAINDKWILDNIDTIKRLFRLSSNDYINFDKIGGYERLYNMSISIIRQLCGNQIIESIRKRIMINDSKNRIFEYKLNLDTLKDHIGTLLKRKSYGLNNQILHILELATNKNNNNNFIDE